MGLVIIVGSVVTGGWLVWQAIRPWAGSVAAVRHVERNGSRFYKTSPQTDALHTWVNDAVICIKEGRTRRAHRLINSGAETAPDNPLFDCLRACAHWEAGEAEAAVAAISESRSKGTLRLYPSSRIDPSVWQWMEVDLICRVAKEISDNNPSDPQSLIAALVMTNLVAWSEPAGPNRVLQALAERQAIARKLSYITEETNQQELINLMGTLLAESGAFRRALSQADMQDGPLSTANRAWAVERTLKDRGTRLSAAALLVLDESARWTEECRQATMSRELVDQIVVESEKGIRRAN